MMFCVFIVFSFVKFYFMYVKDVGRRFEFLLGKWIQVVVMKIIVLNVEKMRVKFM